jgi:hypothetical protein
MKYLRIGTILMLLTVAFSSCTHQTTIVKTKKVPPGQMKKATGSKSAAPYAPGQQKKKETPPGQQKKKETPPGQKKKESASGQKKN